MKKLLFTLALLFGFSLSHYAQVLYGLTYGGNGNIIKYEGGANSLTSAYRFENGGYSPYLTHLVQATDGKLYGMTASGGNFGLGVIFSYTPSTAVYSKLFDFNGSNGSRPFGSLMQASDGNLYGMTFDGGDGGKGVLFSYAPSTSTYAKLYDFDNTNGATPQGSLIQASDGKLYGMTSYGGSSNGGVIFTYAPSASVYSKIYDFDVSNGSLPFGSLTKASHGKLYGMTHNGGSSGQGVIFSYETSISAYTKLLDFNGTNGASPQGSLIEATDGKLYGVASGGGASGIIFSFAPSSSAYSKLFSFIGTNGSNPIGSLVQASDGKLYGTTSNGGVSGSGVLFSYVPATSTFSKLIDFNGSNGANPQGSLVQASDGKLYGMTLSGGFRGMLFSFAPGNSIFSKLYDFGFINGANPYGSLVQASDGKLYGMTSIGQGVIFSYSPSTATFTKLMDFNGIDGGHPHGSLLQATDGKLYGMTSNGGISNKGVIFSFTPSTSTYVKLHDFGGNNGANPRGSLIQASDGKFYGMTEQGGFSNEGVIFSYAPSTSTFTNLLDFNGTDESRPAGSLVLAADGKLYGMTSEGGSNAKGAIFSYSPATSTYSKLYDFNGTTGAAPSGSFVQVSDGKLYGMTGGGGSTGQGVIFSYAPSTATYLKLHDFNGTSGSGPLGSLVQVSDGRLYGMTGGGGITGQGVVFSYDPFISTFTKLQDFNGQNGGSPQYGALTELYDTIPPSVKSIKRQNPLDAATSSTSLTYRVTFSSPVNNVDIADFSLTKTGTANGTIAAISSGSGMIIGVTVSSITGTGDLRLDLNTTGTGITDNSGKSITGGFTTGDAYTVSNNTQPVDGQVYGLTSLGGSSNQGVIFSYSPSTSTYSKLLDFDSSKGAAPSGSLTQASDGKLYGMAPKGGSNAKGVIFSYSPSTSTYSKVFDFDSTNGASPGYSLFKAFDGKLYGITTEGGSNNRGVIFSYSPSTSAYLKVHDFADGGPRLPVGGFIQASDGNFYGIGPGSSGQGVITAYSPANNTYLQIFDFTDSRNGAFPYGSLLQASDGKLYGTTSSGGISNHGVIFSYSTSTSTYTKLYDFNSINGALPPGSLIQATDGKLYGMTAQGGSSGQGVIFSFDPSTGTFSKLHDFNNVNGATPLGNLMQATDGKLYGMTFRGGSTGQGVVFSYDPSTSAFARLQDLNGNNGASPQYGSLTEFSNTSSPSVMSITRQNPADAVTSATSLIYRVTFSAPVNNVDVTDFSLTKTGTANGTITSVSAGSGTIIDVTVNSVTGSGDLRLDLNASGTGITDNSGKAISGGFTAGDPYTITSSSGLTYKYYEGEFNKLPDFNNLTPVQTGTTPNVNIGIVPAGRQDLFAFVWEGYINIPMAGNYIFETISDDGSRMCFNTFYNPAAVPTVDNDGLHGPRSRSGTVANLTIGSYPVTFTYFEKFSGETMQVYWTRPDNVRELIPNSAFSGGAPPPPSTGLTYKYYEGDFDRLPNFNALSPVQTGTTPNLDISVRPATRHDLFAFTWEGYINIPMAGNYIFETISDDGSRLYFNTSYDPAAVPTVDNDGLHGPRSRSGTVDNLAVGAYPITLTFFEKYSGEVMEVYWTRPDNVRERIPNSAFSSAPPPGLTYKYYEGDFDKLPDFNTLTPVKTGITTNVDISKRPPTRHELFAFTWEGYINIPMAGNYVFETISDDGSRLYFSEWYSPEAVPTVENDGLHGPQSRTGTVNNVAVGAYPITFTFFEKYSGETMEVYWTRPDNVREKIPNSAFSQRTPARPMITGPVLNTNNSIEVATGSRLKANVEIGRIFPNPFTQSLNMNFYNPSAANDVQIAIYDMEGRIVYMHHAGRVAAGITTLRVNLSGRRLPPGMYMVGLAINGMPSKLVQLAKIE